MTHSNDLDVKMRNPRYSTKKIGFLFCCPTMACRIMHDGRLKDFEMSCMTSVIVAPSTPSSFDLENLKDESSIKQIDFFDRFTFLWLNSTRNDSS